MYRSSESGRPSGRTMVLDTDPRTHTSNKVDSLPTGRTGHLWVGSRSACRPMADSKERAAWTRDMWIHRRFRIHSEWILFLFREDPTPIRLGAKTICIGLSSWRGRPSLRRREPRRQEAH